jgi:hypothetical protein
MDPVNRQLRRELSRSFEMRHFSSNPQADGSTDFKGEMEYFDTVQRIAFLRAYADFAARYFDDPDLNRPVTVTVRALDGETMHEEIYRRLKLTPGRSQTNLPAFRPDSNLEGTCAVEYTVHLLQT